MKSFLLIVSFFTRLPVPRVEWSEEEYRKGMIFLPFVGLILGGILYGMSLLLAYQPRLPKGIILYFLYLALTGGMHFDGLADSMDALFSGREREKQWQILKDSTLGVFGVISLIVASLFYVYLFEEHQLALLLIPLAGRVIGMCASYRQSHYQSEGMGRLFFDALKLIHLIVGLLLMVGLSYWLLGLRSLAAFGIALLLSFAIRDAINKQWGGLSGDGIGMIFEFSSIVYGLSLLLGGAFCVLF
ncbi:MAG TPA: adenosylcobinamide-GDP ribazoletransferase [Tissierellia bacterium]|nr:adenosylcobinamide-GDP ribazoletransferase [Tissierellia bacterium]